MAGRARGFCCCFQGRKYVHNADELMSEIVAKRLVEHLERAGFVVMKRMPFTGGALRSHAIWRLTARKNWNRGLHRSVSRQDSAGGISSLGWIRDGLIERIAGQISRAQGGKSFRYRAERMIDWLSNEELAALKAWASGTSDNSDWPVEWPARYVIDNLIVDLEAKTTLLKTALWRSMQI